MKISSKLVDTKKRELREKKRLVARKAKIQAAKRVLSLLAEDKIIEAVQYADNNSIKTPQKYLRKYADTILQADHAFARQYWLAAWIYKKFKRSHLADKAKALAESASIRESAAEIVSGMTDGFL